MHPDLQLAERSHGLDNAAQYYVAERGPLAARTIRHGMQLRTRTPVGYRDADAWLGGALSSGDDVTFDRLRMTPNWHGKSRRRIPSN
jgi:hypothetical protein